MEGTKAAQEVRTRLPGPGTRGSRSMSAKSARVACDAYGEHGRGDPRGYRTAMSPGGCDARAHEQGEGLWHANERAVHWLRHAGSGTFSASTAMPLALPMPIAANMTPNLNTGREA